MIARGSCRAARRSIVAAVLVLVGAAGATRLHAQLPAAVSAVRVSAPSAACDYQRCALGIAPVWNGLAVVRGAERQEIANLNFFWARDVEGAFDGDSARTSAARAVHTRRLAATLTDAGALLMAVGVVHGLQAGRWQGGTRAVALAGAGAFALSVPLHFRADGWLSRAVWWHNAGAVH